MTPGIYTVDGDILPTQIIDSRKLFDARNLWLKGLKHGVDFNDAVRAWYDPDRLDFFDENHSSGQEIRWIFLGAVTGTVLFVVETEPDEDTVRIISARRASRNEKEALHQFSVIYGNRVPL